MNEQSIQVFTCGQMFTTDQVSVKSN